MRFGLRELGFVALLLAMPVAAYFFVFQPRNVQIAAARAEIRDKEARLERLEQVTQDMPDLGGEIDRLAEAIELFEQKLPAEQEVEGILEDVWKLAIANKLQPKSVRPEKPVTTAQFAELPIRMQITGDFDGFYAFLLDLEKIPRITRLPTMRLKKTKSDEEGHMDADLTLSIFFEAGSPVRGSAGPRLGRR